LVNNLLEVRGNLTVKDGGVGWILETQHPYEDDNYFGILDSTEQAKERLFQMVWPGALVIARVVFCFFRSLRTHITQIMI
jgi:hypothetical protein